MTNEQLYLLLSGYHKTLFRIYADIIDTLPVECRDKIGDVFTFPIMDDFEDFLHDMKREMGVLVKTGESLPQDMPESEREEIMQLYHFLKKLGYFETEGHAAKVDILIKEGVI